MKRFQETDLRAGGLVLLTLVAVVLGNFLIGRCEGEPKVAQSAADADSLALLRQKLEADSLERVKKEALCGLAEELFPFDPNHADSLELLHLGLKEWQVKNLLAYRRKGGVWHSEDAFSRLYGLSPGEFERLRPYLRISPEDRRPSYANSKEESFYGIPMAEKPKYEIVEKFSRDTLLELNSVDTVMLKKIPGVGSYYAQKVTSYRERLGGFLHESQLDEIEGLPAGFSRWFFVEKGTKPRQIFINKASFGELVRHPYISYEQTKVIVNHIRKYGPLRSWQDLSLYGEFAESDFLRLDPYISFE